ncbi:TPA: KilA-N domain-containing protein [Neisseria gonorrhoeae]
MGNEMITVQGTDIKITTVNQEDYISLTDMVANFEGGGSLIEAWLRNKNTIDFLGVWERINNPDFNSPDFEGIKNQAGLNRFSLSVKQWAQKVNGIGIIAKPGRYGGTLRARSDTRHARPSDPPARSPDYGRPTGRNPRPRQGAGTEPPV